MDNDALWKIYYDFILSKEFSSLKFRKVKAGPNTIFIFDGIKKKKKNNK